jgi:hypothetical protein
VLMLKSDDFCAKLYNRYNIDHGSCTT